MKQNVMQTPARAVLKQPARVLQGTAKPAVKQASDPGWDAVEWNHMRRVGFFLMLGFVFLRVTALHEFVAVKLGMNTYILYAFGPPAILFCFLSGGLQRTFLQKPALWWLGFLTFFYISVVFSHWRGNSLSVVLSFTRTEFILLPVVAGLALTWRDVWRISMTMAMAGLVAIGFGMLLAKELDGGRAEMSFGTMANANDFAAHLAFVLPFVALLTFTRRNFVIRLFAAVVIVLGIYRILSTGSRGALVALLVTIVFVVLRASLRQKIGIILGSLIVGTLLMASLPGMVADRLQSLFKSQEEELLTGGSAFSSRKSRTYLLIRSIELTASYPIFGVGPGQFADVEDADIREKGGRKGAWHVTHNAYTQVSSEAGIPAAFFFIGALVSTFRMMNRTHRKALRRPPSLFQERVAITSYCFLVSFVGFAAACMFLSLAYLFYFPLLTALALAMHNAAEHEWRMEDQMRGA
ncbi:MAG: O-antigen ligase family protein [Bryobacterales bacterium]|nr:O-antigen ligase family protein [Bryobacterales bacterium]